MISLRRFFFKYKTEIVLFTIWTLANVGIFVWKYYDIKAKCNGTIHGPFALIGDIPENRACQASSASCCKQWPYPNGKVFYDPHWKVCTPGLCDDACNLLGRVLGHLLNFNIALTLLPILRNTIWTKVFNVFPFERSVFFHRWIGLFIFVTMFLHGITWWITQPFPSEGWLCWGVTFGFRSDQFNGQLAFIFHAIAALFALNFFRRRFFELFYFSHFLFIPMLGFAIWHTAGVQNFYGWDLVVNFKDDYFVYYLAVPFLMWVADRIIRFIKSNFGDVKMVAIDAEPGIKLTRIAISKPGFTFQSGQYCFICIPAVSRLEWHPFSISSSPKEQGHFTFHIKDMGRTTWTDKLFQLATKKKPVSIKIDGPYGAKGLNPADFEVNALFCGGVGVTPIISILMDIMDHPQRFSRVKRVYFHWVVRDADNLAWFSDFWDRIFPDDSVVNDEDSGTIRIGSTEFVFKFHVTQSNALGDMPKAPQQEASDQETVPLLNSVTAFKSVNFLKRIPAGCFGNGRPNVPDIMRTIRSNHVSKVSTVAVYSCGPDALMQFIENTAFELTDHQLKFQLHKETFYL